MRNLIIGVAVAGLVAATAGGVAAQPGAYGSSQEHSGSGQEQSAYQSGDPHERWSHDQGANHRWNRGDRMGYDDWSNAQPVNYRAHHLRRPPHGYAWRETNGQFILAAVATGLVASIIVDNAR